MKSIKPLLLLALAILFVTSCSVEKRLYNKGFHIEWRKNYKGSHKDVAQKDLEESNEEKTKITEVNQPQQSNAVASVNEEHSGFTTDEIDEVPSVNNDDYETSEKSGFSSNVNIDSQIESTNRSASTPKQQNKEKNNSEGSGSGGKSQLIALVLVLVAGVLGIHRFYLGHIGIGVLMILTAGCCGILALIDLIRIVTGDLKPKDGEYTETL
jgi:hypothetical protein